MNNPTKETLQALWEESKTLETSFWLWQNANPCPSCGYTTLDFLSPKFEHPFICTHCKKQFDFIQIKRST